MWPKDVTTELTHAPLPQVLERLGLAVANAQLALDRNAVDVAKLMADPAQGVDFGDGAGKRSLLELGLSPTFYQITEATIEAKVAFTSSESIEASGGLSGSAGYLFFAANVNASYSAKYSFDAHGSSALTAKFVCVPPPATLTEIIRATVKK